MAKLKQYFGARLQENILAAPDVKSGALDRVILVSEEDRQLKLRFPYDKLLVGWVRGLPQAYYDRKNRWWTVAASASIRQDLTWYALGNRWQLEWHRDTQKHKVQPRAPRDESVPYRSCPDAFLQKLKELRYSVNTIKSYTNHFEEFLNHYPLIETDNLKKKEAEEFLRYLVNVREVSPSYQNLTINAIKFYWEKVLELPKEYFDLDRPMRGSSLPKVISENEMQLILQVTENLKHKCLLMIIFSAGLRISEALNLTLDDLDYHRKQILVRNSKGKKDRYTLLSESILPYLERYLKLYRPRHYFFEGQAGGMYSTTSARNVLLSSCSKAGISKRVSLHMLRHTFATTLHEKGVDLRIIQELLGHSNSRTTEIYTYVSRKSLGKITSPLDMLDLGELGKDKKEGDGELDEGGVGNDGQ
jgi:site-specific recombinase XerD